jgi:multidrug efflux pump subunit AcrA (membrane-fusion protein)
MQRTVTRNWHTQTQMLDTAERIRVAQDVLRRTEVRTQVDGEVVNLKYFAVGAVVRPGDVIMEIVPTNDVRIIDVKVNPNDIDTVRVGATPGAPDRSTSARRRRSTAAVIQVSPTRSPTRRPACRLHARIAVLVEAARGRTRPRCLPGCRRWR